MVSIKSLARSIRASSIQVSNSSLVFQLDSRPSQASACPFPALASRSAELGRQWNTQNPSQPNPGLRADESPCISGRNQFTSTIVRPPPQSWDTVETAYKVYVCPRGNLLYMRIFLITDLNLLCKGVFGL